MAIKFLTLTNFKLYQRPTNNRDYDWILTFEPKSSDEQEIGKHIVTVLLPHSFGLVDNTVNDGEFTCTLIFEDNFKRNFTSLDSKFAFFTRKNTNPIAEIQEPATALDGLEVPPGNLIRSMKGPDGNTYINEYQNKIEIVSGNHKIVVSDEGVSFQSPTKDDNLPSTTRGVFQDKNIFSLIPNFFVTPFPNSLPDMKLIVKIQNILNLAMTLSSVYDAVKSLGDATNNK